MKLFFCLFVSQFIHTWWRSATRIFVSIMTLEDKTVHKIKHRNFLTLKHGEWKHNNFLPATSEPRNKQNSNNMISIAVISLYFNYIYFCAPSGGVWRWSWRTSWYSGRVKAQWCVPVSWRPDVVFRSCGGPLLCFSLKEARCSGHL